MTKAVVVVPSQGDNAPIFAKVAEAVNQKVYGSDAVVVKTFVTESDGVLSVSFNSARGKSFSWSEVHGLSTVMTISHGARCDGPNLDAHDQGYQPWPSENPCTTKELSEPGNAFWKQVGAALGATGKIILVGCNMGAALYAAGVADATGRAVFAATAPFPAADEATTVQHIQAIEQGAVLKPMKKFTPS